MADRTDVLWLSSELQSAEHCTIVIEPASRTIESTTLLPYRGRPARLDYTIVTDDQWQAQTLRVLVDVAGEHQRLAVERSGTGWSVDGISRPDLDACVDVDVGWTPATNLLPLRRHPLAPGDTITTTAAWLRFPELDVVASEQTYTRIADDLVRYQSKTFEAELTVTAEGFVTRYGHDLWIASAMHQTGVGGVTTTASS